MCLDKVETPPMTEGVGYKSVRRYGKRYYSYDHILTEGFGYAPKGEWITDPNNEEIAATDGTTYPAGFHIMLGKDGRILQTKYRCTESTIVKVEFRKAVAYQSICPFYGPSIVAKEMRIIEEVE